MIRSKKGVGRSFGGKEVLHTNTPAKPIAFTTTTAAAATTTGTYTSVFFVCESSNQRAEEKEGK